MKVLHVIETLGRGGAEQMLLALCPELVRQGCAVTVAVRRAPYDLQSDLSSAGISVIRLPAVARWNLLAGARAIARAAADTGADVIHAHLYFPAVCTAVAGWLGLTGAVRCVTFHNLAYGGANRQTWKLRVRRRLAAALYRRGMDGFLAVSVAVADHYRQALGLQDVTVIPNPIGAGRPAPARATPRQDRPCIVLPGRLVPEKGHDILLAALDDPALRDRRLRVVFAGGGPLAERLARPGIEITGVLNHDAFLDMLAQADIVVAPSRHEGFGLAVAEAMALGRPVVASDAGGLPETIGPAGIVVPRGDPAALAGALAGLLDDPEGACRLGRAASVQAARFQPAGIAARHIAAYSDLLRDAT